MNLKSFISDAELCDIVSPNLINIMKTIKLIQKRMRDPDIVVLPYIGIYDTLGKEFEYFSEKYSKIFTMVIRKEDLNTLISVLYYKDKVLRGLMTEEQLMELLKKKYLTPEQQRQADIGMQKLRDEMNKPPEQ